jgi:mRNA interferase MazF
MERKIKRGDIYYANLNPVIGSEQGGTRPVLIISNDVGNKHSPTVIVTPITSRVHTKAKLPTHTLIKDFEGLDKNSIILFEQIRTIDKQRLRKYVGMLSTVIMARADKALAISISLREVNNE